MKFSDDVKWVAKDKVGKIFMYTSEKRPYLKDGWWDYFGFCNELSMYISVPEIELLNWEESLRMVMSDGTLATPPPEYKVDDLLRVGSSRDIVSLRYFSHFDDKGSVFCFADGRTSRTNESEIPVKWYYHDLVV